MAFRRGATTLTAIRKLTEGCPTSAVVSLMVARKAAVYTSAAITKQTDYKDASVARVGYLSPLRQSLITLTG